MLKNNSINAKNAPELFTQADIDGGLIGGASLKAENFFGNHQAYSNKAKGYKAFLSFYTFGCPLCKRRRQFEI